MRKTKLFCKRCFVVAFFLVAAHSKAQVTFPENGIADPRHGHYAFTNATIVKDAGTTITNATLVIRDGKIIAVDIYFTQANGGHAAIHFQTLARNRICYHGRRRQGELAKTGYIIT